MCMYRCGRHNAQIDGESPIFVGVQGQAGSGFEKPDPAVDVLVHWRGAGV